MPRDARILMLAWAALATAYQVLPMSSGRLPQPHRSAPSPRCIALDFGPPPKVAIAIDLGPDGEPAGVQQIVFTPLNASGELFSVDLRVPLGLVIEEDDEGRIVATGALPGYGAYPTVQPGDILRAVSAYKEVITGAPMWRQMMSYTPVGTPQLKRLLFRCDDASYYDVRNAIASHRAGDGGNGIATLVIERAAGAEVPAPDSATLAAIAEATGLEPLKDVVMRDLKNKGDAEAEETRSVPERVDEFFR